MGAPQASPAAHHNTAPHPMTAPKVTAEDRAAAREHLLEILQPGTTVYTSCSHIASSGMMRVIELCIALIDDDGRPYIRNISWLACQAMGARWNEKHYGIAMGGCGMDMGFAAVYNLGQALWPEGTPQPHGTRNGEPDTAGGYALKQSWL